MTEHNEAHEPHWLERFGPFYDGEDLDPKLLEEPGLVGFTTADGYRVYPVSQFDVSSGELRLYPHLAAAWAASRVLDEQIGADEYATHAVFTQPQEQWQGRSRWDMLVDPDTDAQVLGRIKVEIYKEIHHRAAQDRVTLYDPRTTLPEA
jgi:hypothetical protein